MEKADDRLVQEWAHSWSPKSKRKTPTPLHVGTISQYLVRTSHTARADKRLVRQILVCADVCKIVGFDNIMCKSVEFR